MSSTENRTSRFHDHERGEEGLELASIDLSGTNDDVKQGKEAPFGDIGSDSYATLGDDGVVAAPKKIGLESIDSLLSYLLPGPRCVRNILGTELCERFSYYGLRAILVIFLTDELNFRENDAVALFAYTSALAYFMPLVGGYVADAYLGRFSTILYFSSVYCVGSLTLAIAAGFKSVVLTIVGLFLIGVGTGGIKPCVSAFGVRICLCLDACTSLWLRFFLCVSGYFVLYVSLYPCLRLFSFCICIYICLCM